MQTFLPYSNYEASARVLDRARLGKQRVETLQLMRALKGVSRGWVNHPAAKMWRGYECSLMRYQVAVCEEWLQRGYKDTCLAKTWALHDHEGECSLEDPPWLKKKSFHEAHRSNLLRKNADHYRGYPRFDISDSLPYIWPTP